MGGAHSARKSSSAIFLFRSAVPGETTSGATGRTDGLSVLSAPFREFFEQITDKASPLPQH